MEHTLFALFKKTSECFSWWSNPLVSTVKTTCNKIKRIYNLTPLMTTDKELLKLHISTCNLLLFFSFLFYSAEIIFTNLLSKQEVKQSFKIINKLYSTVLLLLITSGLMAAWFRYNYITDISFPFHDSLFLKQYFIHKCFYL